MSKKRPKFEDCLEIINLQIAKKRHKWSLNSLSWIDYDDVAQIIRLHIFNKWKKYDPNKPLVPWISIIVTNQIKNLVRNHYTNYSRPCLRCDAAIDNDGCKIYKEQCEACPLFSHWKKTKQLATFIKLPVSIENHSYEVHEIEEAQSFNHRDVDKINVIAKRILKPIEYKIYKYLYVDHKDESEVAKKMGFISNEKGRAPGYRQIKNIQKSIIAKIKEYIKREGICN